MLRSTRMRLELLGISERQLNGILTSGKATTHLEILSPISGHIIKKYVREGQYVEEGMALYDVADLSTVWIQAQVYEDDLPFLPLDHSDTAETDASNKLAVTVTTPSIPDERFRGTVDFVYPHMDQETRTVTVRCEVENPHPHKLRPGATATASFEVPASNLPVLVAAVSESREQREQLEQGLVLAVPESSVIDTGSQTIVYRETLPGVFEGVLVRLGPRMANAEEAAFFPVLAGLQPGDRIVTAGSFLVDAETRLNPAAGSIYFGGSSGSKTASTTVRPSTPEDPDLKIEAALAKLPAEDRTLAQLQGYCPVLSNSRLGSMGPPVKLSFEGEAVFICCAGCKAEALKDPQATLANVREGKKASRANEGRSASAAHQQNTSRNATQAINTRAGPETTIQKALAALPSAERQLAEKQRFCAVQHENRLGSMGAPYKVMIEGQAVFLCCEACKDEALTHAQETLDRVAKLKQSAAAPEGK
jgi:hypothetical protein